MCNNDYNGFPYRSCGCGCNHSQVTPTRTITYITGQVGPQGPQGEQGPVGPAGPQGEPGTVTPATAVDQIIVTEATVEGNAATINEIIQALQAAGLMST